MEEKIYAPLAGKIVKLEDVPDPTFSQKIMGDGIAIEPINGNVQSPVTGKILFVSPTKHAIGLGTESGLEILIHIGLDTIDLKGTGFDVHIKQGDQVQLGDQLITFDLEMMKEKAVITITTVIITNSDVEVKLESTREKTVVAGQSILLTATHFQKEKIRYPLHEKKDSYRNEVYSIIQALGGEENIQSATHCVTRLRFKLHNEEKVDTTTLDEMDIVKGIFSANGQFQVIIGQGLVDRLYHTMNEETTIGKTEHEEEKSTVVKKENILMRGVQVLADIFIPILPAIITAGLLMGLHNILVSPGIFGRNAAPMIDMYPQWVDFADIIYIIANTAFTFLPALIGWSTVKRFGGNPLLGVVLGLVMVHPELLSAWDYAEAVRNNEVPTWNIFGFEIEKVGYQGQVLPVLFAAWILARLELFLKKHVADSLQLLLVVPVALFVTGFLTFLLIGPLTFAVGNWITSILIVILEAVPIIGGFIYGAIYAPLVITGMHHILLGVDLQLIGNTGSTFLFPILVLSNIAQGSAAFAIMAVAKRKKMKGVAGTSGISAWLGITEPAMFGINLPLRFPFIAAISSAAIAGGFVMMQQVAATSISVGGIPGFLSVHPDGWGSFAIGMSIVMILPFIVTFIIGHNKFQTKEK